MTAGPQQAVGQPTTVPATVSSGMRNLQYGLWAVLGLAAVVGLVEVLGSPHAEVRHTGAALLLATLGVAAILAALRGSTTPARRPFGWTSVLLGAEGRVSTSKVQVWLWTLGLSYAILFLAGIAIFRGAQVFDDVDWNDYAILVGGPLAAAVLAKQTVVVKLANGTVGKTATDAASSDVVASGVAMQGGASLSDVVSTDAGDTDVFDTQYLVFNLVAFVYAAGIFISQNFNHQIADAQKYALPAIPSVLLGLTSAAAATYVGNKATRGTTPRISSVQPSHAIAPDVVVTVTGANLVPVGLAGDAAITGTSVQLTTAGTGTAAVSIGVISATITTVTFAMPSTLAATDVEIKVLTADGRSTDAWPIGAT